MTTIAAVTTMPTIVARTRGDSRRAMPRRRTRISTIAHPSIRVIHDVRLRVSTSVTPATAASAAVTRRDIPESRVRHSANAVNSNGSMNIA